MDSSTSSARERALRYSQQLGGGLDATTPTMSSSYSTGSNDHEDEQFFDEYNQRHQGFGQAEQYYLSQQEEKQQPSPLYHYHPDEKSLASLEHKMLSSHDDVDDNNFNDEEERVPLLEDVYSMFFLSRVGGQAFWYAAYVFVLKMSLFSFIAVDIFQKPRVDDPGRLVRATQFLLLPVAIAIQEDLMQTYYLLANVKFSPTIQECNPQAYKWKWHAACLLRGLDGAYSLVINFVVLLQADAVLTVFLNFAALQFLQTIDDVAQQLAARGYLTERLQQVATSVKKSKLPKKHNAFYTAMDTVLYVSTLLGLLIGFVCYSFV